MEIKDYRKPSKNTPSITVGIRVEMGTPSEARLAKRLHKALKDFPDNILPIIRIGNGIIDYGVMGQFNAPTIEEFEASEDSTGVRSYGYVLERGRKYKADMNVHYGDERELQEAGIEIIH